MLSNGIDEESATGMAAGPLACLLFNSASRPPNTFKIGQEKFMSPPSASRINVNLHTEENMVKSLSAGGKAYLAEIGLIQL